MKFTKQIKWATALAVASIASAGAQAPLLTFQ